MEPKRIVLGADGSDGARHAMEWVIRFAGGLEVEVFVVHGVEMPILPTPYVTPGFDEQWRADLYETLEGEWCRPLRDAHMKYHAYVIEGHPAGALREVARLENAEMIVVGARGRNAVTEILLGSVSHELVHHSETPVLVVPAERK